MNEINRILDELALLELKDEDRQAYGEMPEDKKPMFLKYFRDNLEKKMRAESLKRVLARRYDNYFTEIIENNRGEEITPTLTALNKLEEEKEAKNGEYVFITICPPDGFNNVDDFIKKLYDITKLKYYDNGYIYVFEQRRDNMEEIGIGLHCHLLAYKGKHKLSHCKRDVERIMQRKPCIECTVNAQYRRRDHVMRTQNYMIGQKDDPRKWAKQEYDKIYRQQKNVREYYGEPFNIS